MLANTVVPDQDSHGPLEDSYILPDMRTSLRTLVMALEGVFTVVAAVVENVVVLPVIRFVVVVCPEDVEDRSDARDSEDETAILDTSESVTDECIVSIITVSLPSKLSELPLVA
jgi:hypothetical protein